MEISWYGQSCFKVEGEKAVLVFDPYSEGIGFKIPNLSADVVLVTHNHPDHNNAEAIAGRTQKKPYLISGPGEYEINDVYIFGISSFHDKSQGKERGLNTIYVANIDGIKICHLGDLGTELSSEDLEKIGDVDILFVPVGGVYTISAEEALSVINQIEPKVVIPMHYKIAGLKIELDDLTGFAGQVNISDADGKEVFKVSKSQLPVEEREIVILKPQTK